MVVGTRGSGIRREISAPCSPSAVHRASLSEHDMQHVRSPRPGLARRRPGMTAAPPCSASALASATIAGRAPVRFPEATSVGRLPSWCGLEMAVNEPGWMTVCSRHSPALDSSTETLRGRLDGGV
eukprot:scaffold61775_cov31-Tisochrysis_lutea.AAC.1